MKSCQSSDSSCYLVREKARLGEKRIYDTWRLLTAFYRFEDAQSGKSVFGQTCSLLSTILALLT